MQVTWDISEPETMQREIAAIDAARQELNITDALIITANEPSPANLKKTSYKIIPFFRWAAAI